MQRIQQRMSRNTSLEFDDRSIAVRPLAELPTLRLVERARDVRGWKVSAQDGRTLGTVVDFLVDVDKLQANKLLVSFPDGGEHETVRVLSVDEVAPEDRTHRSLTAGHGMAPIAVRYQSTAKLTLWAAIGVALMALVAWLSGVFS